MGTDGRQLDRSDPSTLLPHRALEARAVLSKDSHCRAVFEASPDATLVADSEGVIRYLNPQTLWGPNP